MHATYHGLEAMAVSNPFGFYADTGGALSRQVHAVTEALVGGALGLAILGELRAAWVTNRLPPVSLSEVILRRSMPSFVALLKISGKTDHAIERLQNLPLSWKGVKTNSVIIGTGGYDAVVVFDAPELEIGVEFISEFLRDNDPLTMIDTVTGERLILN